MEEQNNEQRPPQVEDIPVLEYLDIVKNEYEIERNKKQSFENRAGGIMALLGAICIFLFEKVQLIDIISMMSLQLNFLTFIKIVSGMLVYLGFLFSMLMTIKTIDVNKHYNFEVRNIDENLLGEMRLTAICKIIFTYRDIIVNHRKMNEKRAKTFKMSLYGIIATFIGVIIYIST